MNSPHYLTQDQIQHNKNEYIKLFNEYIIPRYQGAAQLLTFIQSTDFFIAPASVANHLACAGGLCQHTLNVYHRLIQLCKNYVKDINELGTDEGGLALIALCHDLCKFNTYKVEYRNVKVYKPDGTKRDNGGNFEWESQPYFKYEPELVGFGHGGKSLFIVQNYIKNLPLAEAVAIRNHMGGIEYPGKTFIEPETSQAYNQYNLALYLHMADLMATYIDERY